MPKKLIASTLCIFLALLTFSRVLAQDVQPGAWGEVVDSEGNILYDNLTDLGVVTESADWMPTIPGVGPIPAEYHQYLTPDGNIIMAPTATTYIFMALSANQSGFNDAASSLSMNGAMGGGAATTLTYLLSEGLADYITADMGYSSPESFFADVIAGNTNIWTLPGAGSVNFLMALLNAGYQDGSLYTALLLYTPDQCAKLPGGCPPALAALLNGGQDGRHPADCPQPKVSPGKVEVSAARLAPNYILVVGQDDTKRGGDVRWTVKVPPTIVTLYIPDVRETCEHLGTGETSDCTRSNGKPGKLHYDHYCRSTTQAIRESLQRVSVNASLSGSSKDWILNTLSIRYPGTYLHNPSFRFPGNISSGGYEGDTFVWTVERTHIPFADPGWFNLGASGLTSGTPYSQPRGFDLPGSKLDVYLRETAIIQ